MECAQERIKLSQLGAEKIAFTPKSDGHKDIRTDIRNYRVASLLKIRDEQTDNILEQMLNDHRKQIDLEEERLYEEQITKLHKNKNQNFS